MVSSKSLEIYSDGSIFLSSSGLCNTHELITAVRSGICARSVAIKTPLPSLPLNDQVTSRTSMHVQYNLTALM